jgi:hypothetical protein
MKRPGTLAIAISAGLVHALCLGAQASQTRTGAGARIVEQFQKADANGDGKLDRDELPNPERFRQFDLGVDGEGPYPGAVGRLKGPTHGVLEQA